MKPVTSRPGWLLFTITAIVSGALYFFSTGLTGFRPFVWIAPLPVLIMAPRCSWQQTAAFAFVAYLIGGLNIVGYLLRLAPVVVVAGSLLLPSIAFALSVLTFRAAVLRVKDPFSFTAFPVVWTSYEYLLSLISPHGTAGSISYTQSDFLALIQISSFTGIWGITFILTFIPAGIAAAWQRRNEKRGMLVQVLSVLLVGIGIATYGLNRLASSESVAPVRVGVVAVDSMVGHFDTVERAEALNVIGEYSRIIGNLVDDSATFVLTPEKFVGVTREYENDLKRMLGESAHHRRALVVAGLNRVGSERHRNFVSIVSPDGIPVAEYDKAYLLPGFESEYSKGTSHVTIRVSDLLFGVAICKDLDFPSWIRQYGKSGIGILFVPAWDFTSDAWLHSRMAIMRGVENGFALVRCASQGLLTVCDSRGHIMREASSSDAPEVYFITEVNPGSGRTFYSMTGDWFAWINLLLLPVFVITLWRTPKEQMESIA